MSATIAGPRARRSLLRHRLDNGLTVVLEPVADLPAVGVTVAYDVGYRSETRPGFAHLFEHLMFQGSATLPKHAHAQSVQAAGGAFNATTRRDHTAYYAVVPSEALELMLFLEADRMRAPRITLESIGNQTAVVAEEIRRNILNRPYGGFPAFQIPEILFIRHANRHNGYGDFEALAGVGVDECEEFFARHYVPGNAVLALSGGFEPATALELIDRHFGRLPSRPVPERPRLDEAPPETPRTHARYDRLAPAPAVAVGWRCPAPGTPEYLAVVVAAAVLGDVQTGRLRRVLTRERGMASQTSVMAALAGPAFQARDPEVVVATAICAGGASPGAVAEEIRAQLTRLAGPERDGGLTAAEVVRATRRLETAWHAESDVMAARARRLAAFETLYGDAAAVSGMSGALAELDPEQVRAAAAGLAACPPAIVELTAEAGAA
jgi:predicted Zn-dependent peptidase